jgi:hypothetical protein
MLDCCRLVFREGGMEGFRACFADLVDPRRGNAQRHELDEIVMLALLALVSGAETCVDMALFGRSTEALLRRFLRLPGGILSHDTFSRVFRLLEPAAFEVCFARYVAALAERIQGVVAVDGKTARRSFDRQKGRGPLHMISAFACDTRLALGQRKVDGKSNEISALPSDERPAGLSSWSSATRSPSTCRLPAQQPPHPPTARAPAAHGAHLTPRPTAVPARPSLPTQDQVQHHAAPSDRDNCRRRRPRRLENPTPKPAAPAQADATGA